jgi:hypothetical protein
MSLCVQMIFNFLPKCIPNKKQASIAKSGLLSRINGMAYALSEYLTFYNTLSIMKRKLLLVFCIHIGSLCCWAQVYRWDAKILIDTAGLRIYKIKAKTETISNLADGAATPRPEKNELQKGKRANAEKRKVTVTAYIFFDKMAHGNGHAVNGVEIHPIISIKVLE